ncbi:amidohydrolase [Methanorbis rubei]|uniref:5'-deoxyadenosine deaminase n=1 Tax=Methanorbis rubei TaxID=3028300 RepID=A0AAE4SB32_9EURY|nr:5-methylthioadenosine/S-adenosylhomocysteine deaminase [Methanocorpusculaceae archaeon Cs1]
MTQTDTEIFGTKTQILIRNIRLDGKPAEIYLDGTGNIASVGEKIKDHDAEFIIDGNGATALPGMVNMHAHSPMSLLRGYSDDMPLFEWLSTKIWPTEAHLTESDVYWGAKLACLEMIRTGTTTFNDMYFMMNNVADAVDEAGIRACLSYCMIDGGDHEKFEKECSVMEKTVATLKARANPRIIPGVSPHAVYTVSEEGLRWCAEFSERENIPLHIHVDETDENPDCIKAHGMRVAQWLDHCGVLSNRCIAAHCCWLNADDIALFADRGVTVVHNPVSNMKLSIGRALPYPELKAAGVNVALGTDGASSNNDLDMFGEMKTAAILQKFSWNDPTIMPAGEALTIASRNGAKALGINAGVIAPGFLADIILVGKTVTTTPAFNTSSNAVYATSGLAVDTTICDGVVLMHEGVIPEADEILRRSEEVAFDLVRRATA